MDASHGLMGPERTYEAMKIKAQRSPHYSSVGFADGLRHLQKTSYSKARGSFRYTSGERPCELPEISATIAPLLGLAGEP